MKLNKKLTMISMATLLIVSPVGALLSQQQTILAAKSSKVGSLKLRAAANQYYRNGYLNWKAGILKKGKTVKCYGNPVYFGRHRYYKIGRNRYISIDSVAQINGQKTLTLDHNAAIYDSYGRRLKTTVIKKNTPLIFYNTKIIRDATYYRIGKNRYVKATNVGALNGETAYASQTYVTIKENQVHSYTLDGEANGVTYKKGQKVMVDQYIHIPASYMDDFTAANDDSPVAFYRVKGQKDAYLSELDVTPRKAMKLVNYEDLHNTFIKLTDPGDMPIYNANGEATKVVIPHAATNVFNELNVDRLQYIWVVSDNKAELFYHLKSAYVNTPEGNVYRLGNVRKYVGNGFIKASDAKYEAGIKLSPVNTPQEAQADAR